MYEDHYHADFVVAFHEVLHVDRKISDLIGYHEYPRPKSCKEYWFPGASTSGVAARLQVAGSRLS